MEGYCLKLEDKRLILNYDLLKLVNLKRGDMAALSVYEPHQAMFIYKPQLQYKAYDGAPLKFTEVFIDEGYGIQLPDSAKHIVEGQDKLQAKYNHGIKAVMVFKTADNSKPCAFCGSLDYVFQFREGFICDQCHAVLRKTDGFGKGWNFKISG